ncbi:MAG TPA: M24 family metallopeptidase [Phycisphaerae bacterium]
MHFAAAQQFMREQHIDGWLVYDFRGNNPVLAQLLPGKRWTTRRAVLFIPVSGEPVLLFHGIDEEQFKGAAVRSERYLTWREFREWLARCVSGAPRVALEYVPGAILPVASIVDAGTVELIRSLGVEVVSSANLIQVTVACWSPTAREAHGRASAQVAKIKDDAFALIRERLASGRAVNEYEVQQFIVQQFAAAGLESSEPPIVSVNAHSGNPHFEVSAAAPATIQRGDWVLIDMWARAPGDEHVFSDITWVAYAGREVPPRHREVFAAVRAARDGVVRRVQQAWQARERMQGWQLDDVARNTIVAAGFEAYVRHRTGHSLSPGPAVHGLGVNLDNLETHDTREVLPGIGFTVEPGIYLPEFGVRLEINMFVDPQRGPTITSCVQDEVVLLE